MGDLRYQDAGVNIDEGNRAVSLIKQSVASTHGPQVLGGLGGFGGMFAFDTSRWREPVLVSSTDSVGTKVKIAIATGRHRGIGQDLVNHCINDILCCGADPLFFLDYYATGKLEPEHVAEIVAGLADACRAHGVALVGGETAELPGLYAMGDYDIAGFIVGAVERSKIIDGKTITAGDTLWALPSSGLHTNGYSLVRHIVTTRELSWDSPLPGLDAPLADLLLEPHRCYLDAVHAMNSGVEIKGLAHITGGGLLDNLPRVLPQGLGARIDLNSWQVPALFTAIAKAGGVADDEMWRTFNMGIGMVVVVPAGADDPGTADGMPVWRIGTVVPVSSGPRVILQ